MGKQGVGKQGMGKPKVSVVLLAHNEPRFVAEAINSILNQTYRNLELIIVDDGSTDDTRDILAHFKDPRIRLIRQPNLWIGFARNRGVSVASGQYVAAMSHDDVSLPHRLATQMEAMQRDNLDVCFSWAQVIDGEGQPFDHFLTDVFNQPGTDSYAILEKLKFGNFLLAPSVVCRRECYYHFASNVVLFGLQDYALWLQMLRRYRARVLEIPLVRYRVHDRNVSIWRFSQDYRALEANAAQRLADDPPPPNSPVVRAMIARELLATARMMAQNPDSQVEAYVAANRAINLDPTAAEGYLSLASLLSEMGHDEAAQVVRSIAGRVDKSLAYPLPLLAAARTSSARKSSQTRRVESMASVRASQGGHSTDVRSLKEEREYLCALLRQSQEQLVDLQSLLRQSQVARDNLQSLLLQSQEDRDHARALLQQFEDECRSLRIQARLSEEERDRLQAALRVTEEERDALSSHLRAVADGRAMRLLNTLTGLRQVQR